MSEITFNTQNLTPEASGYADSVDKLKQAAKPFMNEAGVIGITRETVAEDAKKIETRTAQIAGLFAEKDLRQALQANPILANKLANLLGCKPEELTKVLSDLNKSVTGLPGILGSLSVSFDKESQKLTNVMLSASEPFLRAVTDGDMRELLKLLIMAFAQLMTTQRESDLNNLNTLMQSFEKKIAEMEKARDEQYNAAMATAISGIVCGFVSLGMSIGATCMSLKGMATGNLLENGNWDSDTQKIMKKADLVNAVGDAASKVGNAAGGIANAEYMKNKMDADTAAEMMNMAMEIARKAREDQQSLAKTLMDAIMSLLSQIQQLNQNARQTEMGIAA